MSVKLRQRVNTIKKDEIKFPTGTVSLYLDIYHNGNRSYEFLEELKLFYKTPTPEELKALKPKLEKGHKLTVGDLKPGTILDRERNKENLKLANEIATKKSYELTASDYNMVSNVGKKTLVVEWMQKYIDKYKKADKRNMQGALNKFVEFLAGEKIKAMTFGMINEVIISDYQDYLRERHKGEGASSYFSRFKKMMKQAYRNKLILHNPGADVPTIQGKAKKKDVLTLEEIQTLANTPTESGEVKRAALFSCVTGLRWQSVKGLTWDDVNLKEGFITIRQQKTENDVQINLNTTALQLLGEPGENLVFDLPTANGANKTLKAMVKRAKIKKKITWHNLRHAFGSNLIFTGADVTTVSSLLGHTSLKHTQRYVRAAKELKERATDKLNFNL